MVDAPGGRAVDAGGRRRRDERGAFWIAITRPIEAFMRSVGRYEWRHEERVPATGAFILAPNHLSELDPVLLGFLVYRARRIPRFLAKASLFRVPVLGRFLRFTGQIPVERAGSGREPLTAASQLIADGAGVVVYPEGTLTRDPDLWPMRGKPGAVRLALATGAPLIPVAHWGIQAVLPRWSKRLRVLPPRKRVVVSVGEPFDLGPWEGRTDAASVTAATDALMAEIARLLGELRGETPPPGRWDPSQHGQSEFGRP